MKNACIFHGTSGTPKDFWYPYIKHSLKELGYPVWIPQLPNTDIPDLSILLPFVLGKHEYNEDSILIGHSSGCPLILSILENIDSRIKLAILVAGFTHIDPSSNGPKLILQEEYDWKKIKNHCEKFVFINSDNDPYGCDDIQGREMFDRLGGELIVRHGEGHMGSSTPNQPYKEFPLLINLVKSFD